MEFWQSRSLWGNGFMGMPGFLPVQLPQLGNFRKERFYSHPSWPEQVEVLLVLRALSNRGKTLMLIVQIVMPYAAWCNSHSCYLKALEIWKAVKYLVVHAPA